MLNLFQKLVLYFVEKKNKHSEQPLDFAQFNRIGILYQKKGQETQIQSFAEKLKAKNKETYLLGFDENPKNNEADRKSSVLTQKDLFPLSLPKSAALQPFITRSFDLIINFGNGACFPLLYIAASANASIKVGPYHPELMPYYDLMFDVKPQDGTTTFIEQFNRFFKC